MAAPTGSGPGVNLLRPAHPGCSAVRGGHDRAVLADCPAVVLVGEGDGIEILGDVRVLGVPGGPGVGRREDRAALAHHPGERVADAVDRCQVAGLGRYQPRGPWAGLRDFDQRTLLTDRQYGSIWKGVELFDRWPASVYHI